MKILFSFALCLAMFVARLDLPCIHADEPAAQRKPQPSVESGPRKATTNPPAGGKVPASNQAKEMPPLDLNAIIQPLRALFAHTAAAQVAAPVDNEQNANAQLNAMQEQLVQQLIPARNAELAFVRMMCEDLSMDQRRKIKTQSDAALKASSRKMAEQLLQQQQRGQGGRQSINADYHSQIRVAMAQILKESLNEEQWTRYTAEASARDKIRKRTAIQSFVSRLDDQLLLTLEQRDKITQSLTSNWQGDWERWIALSQTSGDRFIPIVSDDYITPHLTTEQKSVWQGLQKVNPGWRFVQGQENFDEDWWNPRPPLDDGPADNQPGNLRFRATEIFR